MNLLFARALLLNVREWQPWEAQLKEEVRANAVWQVASINGRRGF